MNLKELKDLIDLIKDTDITELEIEEEGTKIKLKKGGSSIQQIWAQKHIQESFVQSQIPVQKQEQDLLTPKIESIKSKQETVKKIENVVEIVSPMVGTFYRSSSPDSSYFVNEGDTVAEGQVICIIEAMKLMNEVKAEFKCKIINILVENGHAVEYGQPLFQVEQL